MKKKVLIVTPYSKDANSYWRGLGPWSYLAKESRGSTLEIEISVAGDAVGKDHIAWDVICQFDLIFFHRPCRQDDLVILQIARQYKIPTWADYDDWLFELPRSNPNFSFYHQPATQKIIYECIKQMDLISVSTQELYEKVKAINPKTVVIPNAYRTDLFTDRPEILPAREPRFVWRGTNTHDADLLSVAEGFKDLPGKIYFMGIPAWQIITQLPQDSYQVIQPLDNLIYLNRLSSLSPKVMLFPLVDCSFNRCKSNIAWMEAVHAGALCVAPNLPEWRKPGVLTYQADDWQSFHAAARSAFSMNEEAHREILEDAYDLLFQEYDIKKINLLRRGTLLSLLLEESKDRPSSD